MFGHSSSSEIKNNDIINENDIMFENQKKNNNFFTSQNLKTIKYNYETEGKENFYKKNYTGNKNSIEIKKNERKFSKLLKKKYTFNPYEEIIKLATEDNKYFNKIRSTEKIIEYNNESKKLNNNLSNNIEVEEEYDLIDLTSSRKFRKNNDYNIEEQFEENFKIECPVKYKSKIYHLILRRHILILIDEKDKLNEIIELREKRPILILDFDFLSAFSFVDFKNFQFKINIVGYKNEFIFKIENDKLLFTKLIVYLNFILSQSKGNKEIQMSTILRGDMFFKFYFLNENKLSKNARSGDILIFKGYECGSKCQRFFTCEDYGKIIIYIIVRSCCNFI